MYHIFPKDSTESPSSGSVPSRANSSANLEIDAVTPFAGDGSDDDEAN